MWRLELEQALDSALCILTLLYSWEELVCCFYRLFHPACSCFGFFLRNTIPWALCWEPLCAACSLNRFFYERIRKVNILIPYLSLCEFNRGIIGRFKLFYWQNKTLKGNKARNRCTVSSKSTGQFPICTCICRLFKRERPCALG